jgi:anti-sigma28 factor (negative regulator of flagellin synthesis)
MKITNHDVSKVTTGANSPVDKAKDAAPIESIRPVSSGAEDKATGARLTLSGDLEEVGRIADAARETPEIRQDLVEKVKAELASGELDADYDLLAARILQDLGWPSGSRD